MNFKPILFSTEMVKAILSGSKVQTRRVVKPKPEFHFTNEKDGLGDGWVKNCPYGQVGDVLWVRETMVLNKNSNTYWPVADGYHRSISALTNKPFESEKVIPSIHMPKKACRLFLKIKSIRVEKLQDISEEDGQKEGVLKDVKLPVANFQTKIIYRNYYSKSDSVGCADARSSFMTLWKSINGEESWKSNPWVWVIEFERIEKPEKF